MNLNQVLKDPAAATQLTAPEIGPTDILAATNADHDGRPTCPRCGKGIYLEIERRDSGVIPHAAGTDDLEFDPDDSDGTETTLISAYCGDPACGWTYPDAPAALFATTIGYAPVLAWETGKDSLREMLTDVAYAQWEKAQPDAAAQHADTYQAHVTPTPSGYRVTLLAGEPDPATPGSPEHHYTMRTSADCHPSTPHNAQTPPGITTPTAQALLVAWWELGIVPYPTVPDDVPAIVAEYLARKFRVGQRLRFVGGGINLRRVLLTPDTEIDILNQVGTVTATPSTRVVTLRFDSCPDTPIKMCAADAEFELCAA
ncbi:MAG TPA: hypothetical protein PKH77_25970 [Anaerolineae bacterium]|nr:hypothetical protein [Anaerolineae bacterium]